MATNGSVSRKARTGYGRRNSSSLGWKEPRNSVLQRRTRKSPRKRVCDSRRSLGRVNPLRTIERLRAGCVLRGPRNKAFQSSIHRGYQPLAQTSWGQAFSLPPPFQPAFFAILARRRAEALRQAESLTPQAACGSLTCLATTGKE